MGERGGQSINGPAGRILEERLQSFFKNSTISAPRRYLVNLVMV
jgi:hypothetical protein